MTRKTKVNIYLFALINVTIPLWTLYFASRFPLHLKIVVGVVSAIFINAAFYGGIRMKERKLHEKA
ncbi:MAG: hypothetical protein V4555_16665 [Acidobacteriota bacterium]